MRGPGRRLGIQRDACAGWYFRQFVRHAADGGGYSLACADVARSTGDAASQGPTGMEGGAPAFEPVAHCVTRPRGPEAKQAAERTVNCLRPFKILGVVR
jgi:hypothetical protein